MKLRQLINTLILTLMALWLAACHSKPDNVLSTEEMADLMADLYVAESVADVNRSRFYKGGEDSLRKVLKQSILLKHGVSRELLDSSNMYYGHNLDEYAEIHKRVVEILQERMSHADAAMACAGGSVAGDSVNSWPSASEVVLSQRSPQQVITFSLIPDDNWEKGDQYHWSMKTLNMRQPGQWIIAAEYPDGITEYSYGQFQNEGLNQLRLLTDSTRKPSRIYGSLSTNPTKGEVIYIDSISLTRTRVDRTNYYLRHRQQRVSTARRQQTKSDQPSAPSDSAAIISDQRHDDEPPRSRIDAPIDAPADTPPAHPHVNKLRHNNAAARPL